MSMDALDAAQVKNLALGAIVVVVVIGLILGLLISALVGRLIVLVVVVVLAALLWTQRTSVENRVKSCNSNVSFLGYHVAFSKSDQLKCQTVVNR
jgi:protein-S-isoprenylcysteine O-methyltransferase Ste14